MNPKRILIFGMTGTVGGIECFIMNYYRNIDRDKIQFDFISFTNNLAFKEEIKLLGGKIFVFPPRFKHPIQNYKQLSRFFKENSKNYIGVHLNICEASNISVLTLAKKYNIPIRISHSHNSNVLADTKTKILHKLNNKKCLKYSTDYLACSSKAGKWLFGNNIIYNKNYHIINNAIDIEKYYYNIKIRDEIREQLHLSNKLVIGNVSRFEHQKNHKFLIEIFKSITIKDQNAVLLLVGNGSLFEETKTYAKELGIFDKVRFLGVRKDIEKIMQAIDLFVLPSLYEGLPIVLIESQASGLKCFVTKDSVSNESDITNSLSFIPLEYSPEKWAEIILNNKTYNRTGHTDEITKAGYNIKHQAKILENIYLKNQK